MRKINLTGEEKPTIPELLDLLKDSGCTVSDHGQTVELLKPFNDPKNYLSKFKEKGWDVFIETKAWNIRIMIYRTKDGERAFKYLTGDLDRTTPEVMLSELYENLEDTSTLNTGVFD